MTIPIRVSVVILVSVLLIACDAQPRTSSGASQNLDAVNAYCGDGVITQRMQICGNGKTLNNNDCTDPCPSVRLLNALADLAEATSTATSFGFCGDGVRQGRESCDDGNLDETDSCSSNCKLNSSETPSWYVRDNPSSGLPYCGDGLVNQTSEYCDDGNTDDTDHCTNRCFIQNPIGKSNSTVTTNNNQNGQEDEPNQNGQEDEPNQNGQEDESCFLIQTELGLPTDWCD